MRSLDKKGVGLPSETLVVLILLIVFAVIASIIFFTVKGSVSAEQWDSGVCWMSNHLKASNIAFRTILPSACAIVYKKDPLDLKGLSKILVDTWWMYGRGELDVFGTNIKNKYTATYSFKVKTDKELKLGDIYTYLLTHAEGKAGVKPEASDYNYLQKGSKGQTLCFEKGITALKKDKVYFVMFMDDLGLEDKEDKVIVSSKPGEVDLNCPNLRGK
jgi:hypothetical protein